MSPNVIESLDAFASRDLDSERMRRFVGITDTKLSRNEKHLPESGSILLHRLGRTSVGFLIEEPLLLRSRIID